MRSNHFFFLFMIGIFYSNFIFAQSSDDIIGIWLSEDKDGQIRIYKKTNNKFYGQIIWMDEPNYPDGTPRLDKENPDEKLRNRKTMGLEILKSFKFDDDDKEWAGGTIYDPKTGNTYKGYMWFDGDDRSKLFLRGFIGFSIIGRTSMWAREKTKR